jgi:hypothetical protein
MAKAKAKGKVAPSNNMSTSHSLRKWGLHVHHMGLFSIIIVSSVAPTLPYNDRPHSSVAVDGVEGSPSNSH